MMKFGLVLVLAGAFVGHADWAAAHGEESNVQRGSDYAKAEDKPFGRASDPKRAKRTIRIDMGDTMRFSPAGLEVRQNDTVRFIVRNSGKQMHEMVLGTMEELKEHAALMRKHPGMEHDEPWMAHVAPGKTSELGWQFTKPGTYYYGCLIPGHFEAGMVGKVTVKP
jgi:uncharacterized cupredoxin-like copper-binding protein